MKEVRESWVPCCLLYTSATWKPPYGFLQFLVPMAIPFVMVSRGKRTPYRPWRLWIWMACNVRLALIHSSHLMPPVNFRNAMLKIHALYIISMFITLRKAFHAMFVMYYHDFGIIYRGNCSTLVIARQPTSSSITQTHLRPICRRSTRKTLR